MLRYIRSQLTRGSELSKFYGGFETDVWSQEELVVRQRRVVSVAPTFMAAGLQKTLTSQHFDVIIADDLVEPDNVRTKEQREKVYEFYLSLFDLLEPSGKMVVIGCLAKGTRVLRADGSWKPIEEFLVGEQVKTMEGVGVVEAMIPQGKSEIFRLRTRNHEILATANHPFFRGGEFVRLDQLKVGDKIKSVRRTGGSSNGVNGDEIWMLGYAFGDGWITKNDNGKGSIRNDFCLAHSKDEGSNEVVLSKFESVFGFSPKKTGFGYWRTNRAAVGRKFLEWGLTGKAKTKRIPAWVFGLQKTLRASFLEGFIEADGYIVKNGRGAGRKAIELCNRPLIEDLKFLAEGLGYNVSNITSRERFQKPPHSPEAKLFKSHHVSMCAEPFSDIWKDEEIVSIEPAGEADVYDLTVSPNHHFIANGFVVHNTRYHQDDLYARILEDHQKNGGWSNFIRNCWRDGREWEEPLFPEKHTVESLRGIYNKPGGKYHFSAQYMNNPIDPESADFRQEWVRYYEPGTPNPASLYMTVDPAISLSRDADFTAMLVGGKFSDHKIRIVDYVHKRMLPNELVDEVFRMVEKWHLHRVGLETFAFQKTLKYDIQNQQRQRGIFFSIDELGKRSGVNENVLSKEARIRRLQPLFEQGLFEVRGDMADFVDELLAFPRGRHDDLIDCAAWMLDYLVPSQNRVAVSPVPYNSMGWWVKNHSKDEAGVSVYDRFMADLRRRA